MGNPLKGVEISKNKLLLVEGNDDEGFARSFLRYLGISDVQVLKVGGEDSFNNSILTVPLLSGFSALEKFGVIRDADRDYSASFQSIARSLKKARLTPPKDTKSLSGASPQVGIFIMPSDGQNGILEDLCLRTVERTPAMECARQFQECISKKLPLKKQPSNPAKFLAKAYLSAMPDSVPHVGVGAEKDYWDFSSEAMNGLRDFLNLFR